MVDIFKLKSILMTWIIKLIVKYPGIMESKLFLKAMLVFPEKVSKTYDKKIEESGIDYQASFLNGLNHVKNEPEKILDLCTGTGFAAFLAAKHFSNASVEAIDQSSEMIRISQEKSKKEGIDNVLFEIGNATDLKYTDNEFDLVVTSNAPIYLSEAVRVLKSGGSILVAFSFGGDAFIKSRKEISNLLEKNGLTLQKLGSSKKGVFILGQKE